VCAAAVLALGTPSPAAPLAPIAAAAAAECFGDECQPVPPPPDDPTPGTATAEGPPNPPVRFPKHGHRMKRTHHRKRHHGKHGSKHRRGRG